MRTTLKRGIGRAGVNGNGHGVLPPGALSPINRYRQPSSEGRGIGRRLAAFLGWVVVLVLMVAGGAAGGLYLYGHDFASATGPHSAAMKKASKQLDTVVSPDRPAVALVMGTDHRYIDGKEPGRSDTLMLVRTDPGTDTVSMLSFPRDLSAEIHCPGRGTWVDKINAAYATCGPAGPLETVKALTNIPINYLISVNMVGFIQVVNKLGGVYIDVDRRYFNNHTGPFGYAAINLQPGYQKLNGKQALDFVRYRHTDSDLFRNARQQLFVRSAKEQLARFSKVHIPSILKALKKNVEIGRSGGHGVDLSTMINYALFFHGLPGGHLVQVRIQGLEGMADLYTAPENIDAAVQQFMNPDPEEPEKANAAALSEKYRPKVRGINPKTILITVLNGNGVGGAAAQASSQLAERNYQMLLPPASLRADSPDGWDHERTRIFYDEAQPRAKASAAQVAKLFTNVSTGPLTPRFRPYANGATLVVVVGRAYTGTLAGSSPSAPPPRHEPPHTTTNPSVSLPAIRAIRHRVPFRLQYPSVIDRSSRLDPEPPNPRVYSLQGHKAVRLIFTTGAPGEFWGIQETNWTGAPALSEKNFVRHFGGRTYSFYYSGAHLHMIILTQNGASYWVVNTLNDALSNETMIAIARGLRPLR